MFKATFTLSEAMLAAIKDQLDEGFLYFYAGPVPAEAGDALDMGNDHTQVAVITVDNDGTTGLTWLAPDGNVIAKNDSEVWRGTVAFDGAEDGETTLTPTFARFCAVGDNGRGATTDARLQGTVGGPSSAEDFKLGAPTVTANGTNTVTVSILTVTLAA